MTSLVSEPRTSQIKRGLTRPVFWMILLLLASLAFTAVGTPQLPDPGKAMGRQQQIQMGFQAAAHVYQQMPVLPHSAKQAGKAQTTEEIAGIAGAVLVRPQKEQWVHCRKKGSSLVPRA